MKIAKVKLNKQIVLMQRDHNQGYLLHDQQEKKQHQQIVVLLNDKQQNFTMSLLNKTLAKESTFRSRKTTSSQERDENKKQQQNLKQLKLLFEYNLDLTKQPPKDLASLKQLTKEELKKYLAHKFVKDEPLYYDQKKQSFTLLDDLYNALQNGQYQITSYQQWAKWFICNKKKFLAKSIIHNNIKSSIATENSSKRQQVLHQLADHMVNNRLNLDELYSQFSSVIFAWQKDLVSTEKYTQQDVDNPNSKTKDIVVDYPKDLFEFKRQLKKTLQTHQHQLYKQNKFTDNQLLEQYSLELTKYLDHYFPLKKSARRLTLADINHYLNEKTVTHTLQQQFENATMQYLLQQGKYLSYQLGKNITSQDLQRIKVQEAFALQFINACSFAASNLRNIIDPTVKNDIVTESGFIDAFNAVNNDSQLKNAGIHRLVQFLFSQSFDFDSQKYTTDHQTLIKQLKQDNQYLYVINTIRSAIYAVRNNVIHFNNDSLKQLFTMEKYTLFNVNADNKLVTNGKVNYQQQALLSSLFSQELASLKQLFAEKLRTSVILDFYSTDMIIKQINCFSLDSKPLSFIPGFKKIFKWGKTYQFEQQDYLQLHHYFEKSYTLEDKAVVADQKFQARYNLLALIYEHQFIDAFLADRSAFHQAVDGVLMANEKRAEDARSSKKRAFAEIMSYDTHQTPADYLSAVQSQLINEENKKRDSGKLSDEQTGHYQQFIWQLFVKGFDNYLTSQTDLAFVHDPQPQYDGETNQQNAAQQHQQVEKLINSILVTSKIVQSNNSHLAFWLFCKLLDANYLNQLHNQLSKWQQASQRIQTTLTIDVSVFQQIIRLALLTCDITPADYNDIYKTKSDYFNQLQPFTSLKEEKLSKKVNIFVQSDQKTPIVYGAIEQTKKYATYAVFRQLLEQQSNFKISGKDIDDWERVLKDGHPDNPAQLNNQRQQLHAEWIKSKHKTDYKKQKAGQDKIKGWLNSPCQFSSTVSNGQYYQQLCCKLDHYNHLDNKLHFVYIRQLHNLLIDILARFAGFINLLERDFQFLDQSSSLYRTTDRYRFNQWINIYTFDKINIPEEGNALWLEGDNKQERTTEPKKINKFLKRLMKKINEEEENLPLTERIKNMSDTEKVNFIQCIKVKLQFYKKHFFKDHEDKKDIIATRNHIAHFNYLGKTQDSKSILDLLAEVRQLFSYDRKLKNAVAKSFIDLLDRHGLTLRFKPLHENNHHFVIDSLKSKKIKHLAGQTFDYKEENNKTIKVRVESEQVHAHYVEMVRQLLTLTLD